MGLNEQIQELEKRIEQLEGRLDRAGVGVERICMNCKHVYLSSTQAPCCECDGNNSEWEAGEPERSEG